MRFGAAVRRSRARDLPALALAFALVAAGCGSGASSSAAAADGAVTLRLGYFPNITHSQAIVGLGNGVFAEELGPGVTIEPVTFNAGPAVIEALFAGALDISYAGANPAINGYTRSNGNEVRVVAGATSGGAMLVVRGGSGIERPADFAGRKVATPQLGNTQDVALRAWLKANGLNDRNHGGNVRVIPTQNSEILALFSKGDIDAAWVPEPWATRLVQQAGGRVFLDERALWPSGDFVTAQVIVRARFLEEHPDLMERFLRAHVKTTQWIAQHPDEAKRAVNEGIERVTSAPLPQTVIDAAWTHMRVTYDPIAPSLRKSADDAFALGYLGRSKPDLGSIHVLGPLNGVLEEMQLALVAQ